MSSDEKETLHNRPQIGSVAVVELMEIVGNN